MNAATAEAWTLTRVLSPRRHVRVAKLGPANLYSRQARLDGPVPAGPWAMYLADDRGRYRFLPFDLDATGPVREDLAVLTRLLTDAGIPHLVAASGPGGGRHVWVGLAVPLPAARVAELARRLHRQLPSLDRSPLTNPATGCVRPIGAPHRLGGVSRLLDGDLAVLTHPTVTPDAIDRLFAALPPVEDRSRRPGLAAVAVDAEGQPHLPGPRRLLPAGTRAALGSAAADASAQLWRVLLGAVRARWRYGDVAALLADPAAAGLEHARTTRHGAYRVARPAREQTAVLARQWSRAVRAVAETSAVVDAHDEAFDTRAAAAARVVAAVQGRADACPGRWSSGGGPADRRVLDALCALQLGAVSASVAVDIRRLALRCGLGRETARTALLRLQDHAWITQVVPAGGTTAATWALNATTTASSTTDPHHARSQGDPPPAGAGADLRAAWLHRLTTRLAVAHDVFTPRGVGHLAGFVWQTMSPQSTPEAELAVRVGLPLPTLRRQLHKLHTATLITGTVGQRAWGRGHPDQRDAAARRLSVSGVLADRQARYDLERAVWQWWSAEVAWLRLPTAAKRRRGRYRVDQAPLPGIDATAGPQLVRAPYPRHRTGEPDHRRARTLLDPTLDDQLLAVSA